VWFQRALIATPMMEDMFRITDSSMSFLPMRDAISPSSSCAP
jgi:hypothetical protein